MVENAEFPDNAYTRWSQEMCIRDRLSMDIYKNGAGVNISDIGLLSEKEKASQDTLMQLYRNCCAAMLVLAQQKGEEA